MGCLRITKFNLIGEKLLSHSFSSHLKCFCLNVLVFSGHTCAFTYLVQKKISNKSKLVLEHTHHSDSLHWCQIISMKLTHQLARSLIKVSQIWDARREMVGVFIFKKLQLFYAQNYLNGYSILKNVIIWMFYY